MPSRTLSESEYTALQQRVLASAPAGLSERDYQRWIGPAMEQAIGEAENSNRTPEGSAAGRFVEGALQNLNPFAALANLADAATPQWIGKAIGVPTTGPVQAGKNIVNAQLAQLSKALDDAKAGHYSEAAGHGAAGLLPILGPAAANAGEHIGEGDIAGGLGEGAGLLAPAAARAAFTRGPAMAGNVARSVLPESTATAIADRLEAGASTRLAKELGPKVGPNKVKLTNKLADAAPDLLRDPSLGALTREGFAAKISNKLADATAAMDDAADARLATQQVRTQPILKALDDQIARLTARPVEGSRPIPSVVNGAAEGRPMGAAVEPGPNAPQIATLRQMQQEVSQLGPVAPYESVRRIREAWDKVANSKYLSSTAEDAVKSQGAATGAMKGTGALREGLAATDPASAAAYRQYSLFKSADDVLAAAHEAERARPAVGRQLMRTASGATAGAIAHGNSGAIVGATVGWIVDRASSYAPTLQVVIARRMQAIADALRQGHPEQAHAMAVTLKASLPPEFAPVDAAVSEQGITHPLPGGSDRRLQELQQKFGGRGE